MQKFIGIVGNNVDNNEKTVFKNRYIASLNNFIDIPIIGLFSFGETKYIDNILKNIAGVVLCGGESNINHNLSQIPPSVSQQSYEDNVRDNFTINLIKKCYELNIPLIGICRGMQEINVAYNGTLKYNIREKHMKIVDENYDFGFSHDVKVNLNSKYMKNLNGQIQSINSIHMQSVDKIGDELEIIGKTLDDEIEIICHKDNSRYLVGYQHHPECDFLYNDNFTINLFKNFENAIFERLNKD